MRRLLVVLAVLVALSGVSADAQQATLSAPVIRNAEDNLRVEAVYKTRDSGGRWEVQVSVRDSGGVEIRRLSFSGPDVAHATATLLAFQNAERNALGGEIGGTGRTSDFRILTFLKAQGYSPFDTATIVP